MSDWVIESLVEGCPKLYKMRSLPRSCQCKGTGDKAGGIAEAGRETVEIGRLIHNMALIIIILLMII